MLNFKNFIGQKRFYFRYLLISLLSYLYTLSGLFLLVDFLEINKIISFILVYGSAYLVLYAVQLRYLFNKKHSQNKLVRYLISIISFYILANAFYNLGLILNFPYLLSAIFGIGIIIPLRIIVYKYYVYKD
jgi:putative flippase GtrA